MVRMSSKREILGDFYYRQAKREGFRSRSALKLQEIAEKYSIVRSGDHIVDLGSAPGGWLQVERDLAGENGLVIGVDLSFIRPLPYNNVRLIKGDINDPAVLEEIISMSGGPVDVLTSDLAPKFSGIHDFDHARQISLARAALACATKVLRRGGKMVIKVLTGSEFAGFQKELERSFANVKVYKPKASRERSSETYIVCKGFSGDRTAGPSKGGQDRTLRPV
jgi:23S rRNA (uridine2552-2'-O)-methyltransferase